MNDDWLGLPWSSLAWWKRRETAICGHGVCFGNIDMTKR